MAVEIKSKVWSDASDTGKPAADIPLKEEVTAAHQDGQESFILQPKAKLELKTKRVNAVFRPSIYEKFAQIAKANGYSANEALNMLIEKFVAQSEHQN